METTDSRGETRNAKRRKCRQTRQGKTADARTSTWAGVRQSTHVRAPELRREKRSRPRPGRSPGWADAAAWRGPAGVTAGLLVKFEGSTTANHHQIAINRRRRLPNRAVKPQHVPGSVPCRKDGSPEPVSSGRRGVQSLDHFPLPLCVPQAALPPESLIGGSCRTRKARKK